MTSQEFQAAFETLTGHPPFPWQTALYEQFVSDRMDNIPAVASIPTGLGKTSIIAIWLLALIHLPQRMPRRLVYVVNRRTVVDQTTNEVERLRKNLTKVTTKFENLAISTLRGQFADNREWSADPCRPAVICGTVDMIGSRLLFSGYGVGFRAKPLHAGFLGQDALLVHDEAHLEPAFQRLIEKIQDEQKRCNEFGKFRVIELTATTRSENGGNTTAFTLTPEDREHSIVKQRIEAKKQLHLTPVEDDKQSAGKIAQLAASHKDAKATVLVFVKTLEAVTTVEKELRKTGRPVVLLTGTMRGKERDDLVKTPEFRRFLKDAAQEETVHLVCTSAGEVGIDISADYMVCDLSTFESMAQRLGRVNRYGEPIEHVARIDVVHPTNFDVKDKLAAAREATLALLHRLNGDASPKALGDLMESLTEKQRKAAFAPEPTILPVTDILFDAWTLTTIKDKMPGRPPVEPYLHGIAEWQPPETQVAWRQEVEILSDELRELHRPTDLLDDYPLKPHELLRDRSDRVFKHLEALAKRSGDKPAWLLDNRGNVKVTTLEKLADKQWKGRINGCTILLPPIAGGLTDDGMLDGASKHAVDVADDWYEDKEQTIKRRKRLWDDKPFPRGMRLVRPPIDILPDADEIESEESTGRRYWYWYTRPRSADDDSSKTSMTPITLDHHTKDVVDHTQRIADALLKDQPDLHASLILAAWLHDLGKRREIWQRSIGNPNPGNWHAKSGKDPITGKRWIPRDICPDYRHEFGSLLDVLLTSRVRQQADTSNPIMAPSDIEHLAAFAKLTDEMKDLVLHLIAAHHGRARPHFAPDEAFDPDRRLPDAEALAIETPRRFARLQRKYGRWGLAYLESLLRAADWAASAAPSADADESEETP